MFWITIKGKSERQKLCSLSTMPFKPIIVLGCCVCSALPPHTHTSYSVSCVPMPSFQPKCLCCCYNAVLSIPAVGFVCFCAACALTGEWLKRGDNGSWIMFPWWLYTAAWTLSLWDVWLLKRSGSKPQMESVWKAFESLQDSIIKERMGWSPALSSLQWLGPYFPGKETSCRVRSCHVAVNADGDARSLKGCSHHCCVDNGVCIAVVSQHHS